MHTHTPMHTCTPVVHTYTHPSCAHTPTLRTYVPMTHTPAPIMHTHTRRAHARPHCAHTCRAHTLPSSTHTCPYSAHPHLPCTCTLPSCTHTCLAHTGPHRAQAGSHCAHPHLPCTPTPAVRPHAPSSVCVCRLHWVSPEFLKCQHRECLCRVGTHREAGRGWSPGKNQDAEGIS